MKTKKDILEYVAVTAGIKLRSDKDKWVNPAESAKQNILDNLDKAKELVGKPVIVEFDDTGKYLSFQIDPEGKTSTESTPIKNTGKAKPKVINLQGKEFVTHEGLLETAHNNGLERIKSELIINDGGLIVFKATVFMSGNKIYEAHGDADDKNVGTHIKLHKLRMAETRAVNRALRFATNIGMCSIDELGDEPVEKGKTEESKPKEVNMSEIGDNE